MNDLTREQVKIQGQDILVGGSANCVAEAQRLESLGFDFVIAQGGEAGGHRGSYLRDPYQSLTGTLALTRLVVPRSSCRWSPRAASWTARASPRRSRWARNWRNSAPHSSPAPKAARRRFTRILLLKATEDNTRLTEKFSGKPARGLSNRFMTEMAAKDAPQLAFPAQNAVTGSCGRPPPRLASGDFIALWAGQAAPLSRALPAAELIAKL